MEHLPPLCGSYIVHVNRSTCKHTPIHIDTHTRILIHIHVDIHIDMQIYTHRYTYTHSDPCI